MPETHSPTSPTNESSDATPTSRTQKLITLSLWLVLGLVMVGVVVARLIPHHADMPVLYPAPRFALTDQNGKPFGAADLRRRPYICDFIFTTCGSACPMMSHKMAQLQKQTPAQLRLVSFTVNPEHDTPAVLKEYAGEYKADPARWHFLTGTRQQALDEIHGMKVPYQGAAGADPILHSQKFFLVDGAGNVRGLYDSEDAGDMKRLVDDAAWLTRQDIKADKQ
ncbi:MAG TPA: SCO family protein [Tepidisphaeraceae bacterium]|nr:SCO family protein [Tepidisphaeraceae bacterium]